MKIAIKNAHIVNFDHSIDADILIKNGHIEKIGSVREKCDKEIDATGKIVLPGFIDMHTHIRAPGREDEEDFESASQAAVRGGFTTIFCMPNTVPAVDNESCAQWIYDEGARVGKADTYPVGAITKKREGRELTEFCALKRAGCLSLSDDGTSVADSGLLRRALEYAKMCDILIISHCEDKRLSGGGVMRESALSSQYGVGGIPSISESVIVLRDIEIARYVGARIHLAHISTKRSIEIVKRAKEAGVKVSCETAPHYFVLTIKDVEKANFDGCFKVNPPLGEEEDVAAVRQALQSGVIDCIATDHAPHSKGEKELPFQKAPFGFIGLEWAFALSYTYLVKEKVLDVKQLVEKMSYAPARILGLNDRGYIKEGYLADLVIADENKQWTIREEEIASKSKNTPFLGVTLQGCVEYTLHRGKIVYKNV